MALADGIVVRVRTGVGRGLFVERAVRAGEALITYDGPVVSRPTRYSVQIDEQLHVEGTPESNAYLNHSCAPNAYVDWDSLCLRSLRDIAAGEEITCNYLTTDWELHEPFVCGCGAAECFGEIKGFGHLSPDVQRRLAPFAPEFMRRRIGEGAAPQKGAPLAFANCYEDRTRAAAYAQLGFAGTYHLAFRDVPAILREHVRGTRAIDFGCGAGRSTRFIRGLGFDAVGVDIAPEMIEQARQLDPAGDYRLIPNDDFHELEPGSYDLATSFFTFDNVPGTDTKVRLFRDLGALLTPTGRLINVVSSPEIYLHDWASFSASPYPENRFARSGDVVRIITTDFADRRPAHDILFTGESYREVYARAGLQIVTSYAPLATGDEPYAWVNETTIAPWVIYVLRREPLTIGNRDTADVPEDS